MKNETKHTLGEWKKGYFRHGFGGELQIEVYADKEYADNEYICVLKNNEEAEANAKLIAAAPILFNALVDIHHKLGDWNNEEIAYHIEKTLLANLGVSILLEKSKLTT